jgi:RND family efflux transporter MFP subunit
VTEVLSQTQLDTYKTNVTSLGSQVETAIATIRGTESEITQTELSLSTLQKEKDSKLAEANAQATQVQGQMSVSETLVDNSLLRAPFDGVITAKNTDVGGVVGFGSPVYHLVQDDVVKVTIGMPDELSDSFSVGENCFVYLDENENNKTPAKITKIYPAVDPKNNKVTIELEIDNKGHTLKVGSIVNVSLPHKNSSNGIVIPKEALVLRYGLSYVFVVKDGVVARRIVRVGIQTDSSVEIIYGLSYGDIVVKEGGYYLRSGDKVKVSSSTEYVSQ